MFAIAVPVLLLSALDASDWMLQLKKNQPRAAWNWLAVAMAFAGVPLACRGFSLPSIASYDEPVASARLGGHVYHLWAHFGAPGFGQYELYECDRLGLSCQPHDMSSVGAGPGDSAELIANPADSTLTIKVNGSMVSSFLVHSLPQGPRPTPPYFVGPAPVTVTPAEGLPAATGTPPAVAHLVMQPEAKVFGLAFSPDGRLLAGAADNGVRI